MNAREKKALEQLQAYASEHGCTGTIAIVGGRCSADVEELVKTCSTVASEAGFHIRTTSGRGTPGAAFAGAVLADREDSMTVFLPWLASITSRPEFDPTGGERKLTANDWAMLLNKPLVDDQGEVRPDGEQPSEEEYAAASIEFQSWKGRERGEEVELTAAQVERRAHGEYRRLTGAMRDFTRYAEASSGDVAKFSVLVTP